MATRADKLLGNCILKLAATARRISEAQDYGLRIAKTSRNEIGGLSMTSTAYHSARNDATGSNRDARHAG